MGWISDFKGKIKRKYIIPIMFLGVAAIGGTCSGTSGGFTPLYNVKTDTAYGLNIGVVNRFQNGSKFRGVSLALYNGIEVGADFKGGSIAVVNFLKNTSMSGSILGLFNVHSGRSKVNGLEVSLMNLDHSEMVGGKIPNASPVVNGGQIGLVNRAKAGKVVQLGIYNDIKIDEYRTKRGLLLNYGFKGRSKK